MKLSEELNINSRTVLLTVAVIAVSFVVFHPVTLVFLCCLWILLLPLCLFSRELVKQTRILLFYVMLGFSHLSFCIFLLSCAISGNIFVNYSCFSSCHPLVPISAFSVSTSPITK